MFVLLLALIAFTGTSAYLVWGVVSGYFGFYFFHNRRLHNRVSLEDVDEDSSVLAVNAVMEVGNNV